MASLRIFLFSSEETGCLVDPYDIKGHHCLPTLLLNASSIALTSGKGKDDEIGECFFGEENSGQSVIQLL